MFQALLLAAGTAASDDETKGGRYAHFNGMFFMVVFVAAVFLVGKITGALGAPSLVGEILVGVLLTNWTVLFVPRRQNLLLRVGGVTRRDGTSLAQVHRGAHHPFALPDDDDHEAEEALVFGTPQYTRPAAPHHLHDVELAPDGGTLLDDSAHIRRRSFSHSDLTRLSPPRPTAAERASSDGAAMRVSPMRGSKSSGQLTHV